MSHPRPGPGLGSGGSRRHRSSNSERDRELFVSRRWRRENPWKRWAIGRCAQPDAGGERDVGEAGAVLGEFGDIAWRDSAAEGA